jgi:hypothetical protein
MVSIAVTRSDGILLGSSNFPELVGQNVPAMAEKNGSHDIVTINNAMKSAARQSV